MAKNIVSVCGTPTVNDISFTFCQKESGSKCKETVFDQEMFMMRAIHFHVSNQTLSDL